MDALYFAFANQPSSPLPELTREDAEIIQLLEPLAANDQLKLVHDSFTTLKTLANNIDNWKENLVLFHFGGHAGPNQLDLLDGSAKSRGIIALLEECPRLQLVVLNGCATRSYLKTA